MARGRHYAKLSLSNAARLSLTGLCILLFLFLSLCRLCVCAFLCSLWSLVDVPLIFFCPADHVPDWQPRVLLGMVEARSVNVKKTTTTTVYSTPMSLWIGAVWTGPCLSKLGAVLFPEDHALYRSWEGGKMTHQPTISQTDKNTQRKFDPYLGTCDFSVPWRSGRLSSGSRYTIAAVQPKDYGGIPCF